MSIAKLTTVFKDDGSQVLNKALLQPIVSKINEIIDAGVQPATTKILIAAEADNNSHGNVSVHGLNKEDLKCPAYYAEVGEYVVLHAKGTQDYSFSHWATNTGGVESTLADRTILVDSSMQSGKTYKAVFVGTTVTIGASVNDATMGSVKIDGQSVSSKNVTKGNNVTLTATSNTYYQFKEWQNASGTKVGETATLTISANADEAYKAVFEASQIGDIEVEATYDTTSKKLTITKVSAQNAKECYIVNGGTETKFTEDGTFEYTAAATLSFKATSDITGVTSPKTTAGVETKVDADADKVYAKSTSAMSYSKDGGDSVDVAANTDVELSNGTYAITSNNKSFEIKLS